MKDWIKSLDSINFKDFKGGKYSQSYQDHLLEYIFSNIGSFNKPPFCVEFGFNTDSFEKKNSGINVLNFIRHHKWDYLLLDGLRENSSINLHKHFLTSENICDVLAKYNVPKSPEYISIDVDSTDLWLFESVIKKYKPMVYSVEYNCHFPYDKAITFPNDTNFSWKGDRAYGASLKALKIVAEKNGYSLIWVVKYLDAFFIRNDLIDDGSDFITFPYQKWKNHCELICHKRARKSNLINEFIDYEIYLNSNYDLNASKKAAEIICKDFIISSPLSFKENKFIIYKFFKKIIWHMKNPHQKIRKITRKIAKKLIRIIPKIIFLIPKNFFLIDVIEKSCQQYLGKGYSLGITKEINYCLNLLGKEPNIFIDIGSNKGNYTDSIIKKYPNIECHLFEPSKINFKDLNNKFPNKNIKINNVALSNIKEEAYLYSDSPGSSLASLTKRNHEEYNFNLKEKTKVIRFDEYWKNSGRIIDFAKIDVEGHELNVLKGFGELIYKTKLIQFEFGGTDIDTRTFFKDFWFFFNEKNFSIFRMTPFGLIKIKKYSEKEECFLYSNFIAYNDNLLN